MSVCVSVCLSVCDHIFGTTRPIFTKFFVHVAAHGLVLLWRRSDTLCTSGFMADVICADLIVLINKAWIRPVPKVTAPTQHSDFQPISITPVLTRALERTIVHDFIYPALQNPTTSLVFHG